MNPFFNTPQRLQALQNAASFWKGTPWCPNSEEPRLGVSCHNLPRALYVACGHLAPGFPKIVGDPTQDKHSRVSRMELFLDGRREFSRVNDIQAGDLLGIRIYKCIDHLGVAIGAGLFVHVLMHKHTDYDLCAVPPWQQRIEGIWRPMED